MKITETNTPTGLRFEVDGLEELAKFFDGKATHAQKNADALLKPGRFKNLRLAANWRGEANAYTSAAQILRSTTIVPKVTGSAV